MNCHLHTLPARIGVAALLISASSTLFAANSVERTANIEADGARSEIVRYDDLNPNSDAGVRAIYAKLRVAAAHVCGEYDGRDLRAARESRRCFLETLNGAVASADNARLAALHQSGGTNVTVSSLVGIQD